MQKIIVKESRTGKIVFETTVDDEKLKLEIRILEKKYNDMYYDIDYEGVNDMSKTNKTEMVTITVVDIRTKAVVKKTECRENEVEKYIKALERAYSTDDYIVSEE